MRSRCRRSLTDTAMSNACLVCKRAKSASCKVEVVTVDLVQVPLCRECQADRFAYQRAVEIVRGMK